MNKQSLFFTAIVAIVATALMLILIIFYTKKQKIKSESDQIFSISYSIWITSIMVSFFMYLKVALDLIENSIELIVSSKTIESTFLTVMEKIIIFSGFTFIFTTLSYFIVHNLLKVTMGNRVDSIELEKENKGYFIIKALILIMLSFSLLTIFQDFLSWFMIKVETPFYH